MPDSERERLEAEVEQATERWVRALRGKHAAEAAELSARNKVDDAVVALATHDKETTDAK